MFKRSKNRVPEPDSFQVTEAVLLEAREILGAYVSTQPLGEPYVRVIERAGRFVGAPSVKPETVWDRWLNIAQAAYSIGDHQLAVQVFFFAWGVKQADLSFDTYTRLGFANPRSALEAIVRTANASASAAPASFAADERPGEPPVPRTGILTGTQSIIDRKLWV